MKNYEATEMAYKNGYDKGYEDGKNDAVVYCKNCHFGTLNENNGKYLCKAPMGLNRLAHPNEFCSWGLSKDNG